ESDVRGIVSVTIYHLDADPLDGLPTKLHPPLAARREARDPERNAGDVVFLQPRQKTLVVEPGRADYRERSLGTAAEGERSGFEAPETREVEGRVQRSDVGRRIDPGQAGLVVPFSTPPSLDRRHS